MEIKEGIVDTGFTFIFQIVNVFLLIGLLYALYYLIFRFPRKLNSIEERLETIERNINKINKDL